MKYDEEDQSPQRDVYTSQVLLLPQKTWQTIPVSWTGHERFECQIWILPEVQYIYAECV